MVFILYVVYNRVCSAIQVRFRRLVSNTATVVFKDVPRLVYTTCVYDGLPASRLASASGKLIFDGRLESESLSLNEHDVEWRRRVLVARLVRKLREALGEHGEAVQDRNASLEEDSEFDLSQVFKLVSVTEDGSNGEFALADDSSCPDTWALLQAINQTSVFPALAALHVRLAEFRITQSPLLDQRGPEAWTVAVFIGDGVAKTMSAARDGQSLAVEGGEGYETDVLVRHKRWMRSSDPLWPFTALWYLDIHYQYDNIRPNGEGPESSQNFKRAAVTAPIIHGGPSAAIHLQNIKQLEEPESAATSQKAQVRRLKCIYGVSNFFIFSDFV